MYAPSPARDANLARLRSGAAAAVTGQQVGLFLGPMFTLYKAAAAISVARALERESGTPVVPIFWLQTEDHDLVEVASCAIPEATVAVPASAESRISLEHVPLPDEVEACLHTLRAHLARLPNAEAHLERLARHYRPGRGFAAAFAGLIAELFAPEGLVLIDARDRAIGTLPAARELHRRALEEAPAIAAALIGRVRELEETGFKAAVHVREGAPLAFFHPHGAIGPRYRLDERFAEIGGSHAHTRAALLAELDRDPLAFSTSALLRPVLQDRLLPTAAYIAGPGEVAYFAQLPPLYRAFEQTMPLIVPRARFRVLEEKTLRILARLGVTADQAALSEDALLAAARAHDRAPFRAGELETELASRIDVVLDSTASNITALGEGLDTAIDKTRASIRAALKKLGEKYERALLHQDQALVEDVRRLRALLYPNGTPQERVYGFPYFAARYGDRTFITKMLEAIDPFVAAPKDLSP